MGSIRGVSTEFKGGRPQGLDLPVMVGVSPFEPGNVMPVLFSQKFRSCGGSQGNYMWSCPPWFQGLGALFL